MLCVVLGHGVLLMAIFTACPGLDCPPAMFTSSNPPIIKCSESLCHEACF